ncbi:hypothetical protein FSP39_001513 [Pinctada imbricata]|uniref:Transposon Ty3-I Gag-Pol polyprotein n=1 Tax=Pinctada imbricata TaxID=66713 RepID=A0AA88XEC8_PINIB|nr:hypothetical protein FSP39_001513 [Pinctada imbricata]
MPDAIIGQDFLLKYANKIDLKKLQLITDFGNIPCWIGGETKMICNVKPVRSTTVPPKSRVWLPIHIPSSEKLAPLGIIEPCLNQLHQKSIFFSAGIIDLRDNSTSKCIDFMNLGNEPVTLYPNSCIGTCESYYETVSGQCGAITTEIKDEAVLPDHLQDLFKRSIVHLTEDQKADLKSLLIKYQDIFSKSSQDIGQTNAVQHRINTGTAPPIRQPPRRLPFGKREIEKEEIQKMLEKGVIEPSSSPWSSCIVLVNKRDGTTRFCVDYRKLNDVTIKDAYPLPRVDECLDSLSDSIWFSCLDLNSGFWQIAMANEDKEKTAFSTSQGLFQFTVMPFGLANSPSTFERLMENVLGGLQWEKCLVYMDDIIVPGASFEEEIERLEMVLTRLSEANLKLKPSKCLLFQKQVSFLGHIVSADGIQTDPKKIEAVKNWPTPKTQRHVKSFLGLASYYRRFIKGFAEIARPLHRVCEKGSKFNWTDIKHSSFDQLKTALTSPPILAYPVQGKQFILDTDASNTALGAVLSQEQDGKEKVIAYMSKSLSRAEESYCVTRKELLAVVVALRKFHSYLYGQKVLLRTDNAAVSWMRNLKAPTGQVARWLQELGTFDLEVVHRTGRKNGNADALSRSPCKSCQRQMKNDIEQEGEDEELTDEHICATTCDKSVEGTELWSVTDIRNSQLLDENIKLFLIAKEAGDLRPEWEEISSLGPEVKILWNQWDRLHIRNGLLCRLWQDKKTPGSRYQIVVPTAKRDDALKYHHDIPSSGHLGHEKTLSRLKQKFYWPSMKETVKEYCSSCLPCATKKTHQRTKAPLGSYVAGGPNERIQIDIFGPLPKTTLGNKFILVICDCFTKWTMAVPIVNQEAITVANALLKHYICFFGVPLQIHTDRGKCFESTVFQELCQFLKIDKTRTTSMRPQSNGNVERFNRTLANMLTMYCERNQHQWDEYLPQVMMAYRSSVHSSTGFTPNMMTFGKEITLPLQAVIGIPDENLVSTSSDFVKNQQRKLNEVHECARKALKKNAQYMKKRYDLKAKKCSLPVGMPVLIHDPTRKVGVCPKLCSIWKGPYIITKKIDDTKYKVRKSRQRSPMTYHIDRIIPYRGRSIPKWIEELREGDI